MIDSSTSTCLKFCKFELLFNFNWRVWQLAPCRRRLIISQLIDLQEAATGLSGRAWRSRSSGTSRPSRRGAAQSKSESASALSRRQSEQKDFRHRNWQQCPHWNFIYSESVGSLQRRTFTVQRRVCERTKWRVRYLLSDAFQSDVWKSLHLFNWPTYCLQSSTVSKDGQAVHLLPICQNVNISKVFFAYFRNSVFTWNIGKR